MSNAPRNPFAMLSFLLRILLCSQLALALGPPAGSIKNLVTFGDSYSDINSASDGSALLWPQYAAMYGNFSLFPYAKNSAVCNSTMAPRTPGPGILQDELPVYFSNASSGLSLDPQETIYTLWIGTNDLGSDTTVTGHDAPGTTLVDLAACPLEWIKQIHSHGGRNFIIQNVSPLRWLLYIGTS